MPEPVPPADHSEYNATVTAIQRVHEDLLILRVRPDGNVPAYEPGQYTTLGLLTDERRFGETEHADDDRHRLIRRAYSISCPMLDETGALVTDINRQFLEFYIALVRKDSDSPPSLTPRIFAMDIGHRIFLGPTPRGTYTLHPVGPNDDVVFAATGTGEAPHNAMIHALLSRKHRGRIASFVCVRHKRDLAYLDEHRVLQQRFENYRYVPLTTREPENTKRDHPNFVGKQYLQDVFSTSQLHRLLGWSPDPEQTHVFLCGNPSMIGAPKRDPDGHVSLPDPKGMIETLIELGFRLDRPRETGNIHFERYW